MSYFDISLPSFHHVFFYYYCAHRDLPSFPTRRSSDLAVRPARSGRRPVANDPAGRARVCRPRAAARLVRRRPCAVRSEEHTSELQSLRHLVCRLLLEKKKKQIMKQLQNIRDAHRINTE